MLEFLLNTLYTRSPYDRTVATRHLITTPSSPTCGEYSASRGTTRTPVFQKCVGQSPRSRRPSTNGCVTQKMPRASAPPPRRARGRAGGDSSTSVDRPPGHSPAPSYDEDLALAVSEGWHTGPLAFTELHDDWTYHAMTASTGATPAGPALREFGCCGVTSRHVLLQYARRRPGTRRLLYSIAIFLRVACFLFPVCLEPIY